MTAESGGWFEEMYFLSPFGRLKGEAKECPRDGRFKCDWRFSDGGIRQLRQLGAGEGHLKGKNWGSMTAWGGKFGEKSMKKTTGTRI